MGILRSIPNVQFRQNHICYDFGRNEVHRKMRNKNIILVDINLDGICHLTLRRQKKAEIFFP